MRGVRSTASVHLHPPRVLVAARRCTQAAGCTIFGGMFHAPVLLTLGRVLLAGMLTPLVVQEPTHVPSNPQVGC